MKSVIRTLIVCVLLGASLAEVTNFSRPASSNFSTVRFLDDAVTKNTSKLSVEKIRNMIIDIHKNIKLCIEYEFAKQNEDLLDFKEILRGCVGDNYAIILKFYDDMNAYIRELTKDNIKAKLRDGFCNNHLIECLDFFKIVEILIDKDFDLLKSIEFNRIELSRKLGASVLNHLTDITESELEDYNIIRQDLLDERKFLNEFFRERYDEYVKRTGKGESPVNLV
jgi:hypothetical protein